MLAKQSKYLRLVGKSFIVTMTLVLIAVQVLVISTPQASAAPLAAPNYRAYADSGMVALQGWYNTSTGQWDTAPWWNSASALEALIDYSRRTGSTAYLGVISNTFDRNQAGNFITSAYDDEGWWALTWIKAYDLTGEVRYLNMAKTIFNDMKGGWSNVCGGGIWWNKDPRYKNAITNELFLTIAIRLHQRTPGDAGTGSYIDWAQREWNWFNASGMINSQNLINDGLNDTTNCLNNGYPIWTYNQGVILGGLVDMYKVTNNVTYLTKAQTIADATITQLVDANGILKEVACEPNCGPDAPQFKGIFMRNLAYLHETQNRQSYRDFITRNADSIWLNNRNSLNQFGLMWGGPFDTANAKNQGSAQDALNAAIPYGGPTGYTFCANENGTCSFSGTVSVAYGANNLFNYGTYNNSVACNNATFGDPIPGTAKACYYQAVGVIFYQDANYGGAASASKAQGDYAVLPGDVPNDWMSSLRVPSGWSVDVYADGNFVGAVCTFTADTTFVGSACNDIMSSFRVRATGPTATPTRTATSVPSATPTRTRTPTTGPSLTPTRTPTPVSPTGVIFYQHANYGGVASGLKAKGDYAVMPGDVPNDWMSSLRVPAGWIVDAYADGGFAGAVCTYTADTSWVGSGCNDVMSSFRIR